VGCAGRVFDHPFFRGTCLFFSLSFFHDCHTRASRDKVKAVDMMPLATMEAGRRNIAHANYKVVRRRELRCVRSTSTYILCC
jgi:hypothetical protein